MCSIWVGEILRLSSSSLSCESRVWTRASVKELSYESSLITGDFWTDKEEASHMVQSIFKEKETGNHADCILPLFKSVYFRNYLSKIMVIICLTWLSKIVFIFVKGITFLKIMLKSRSSGFHNFIIKFDHLVSSCMYSHTNLPDSFHIIHLSFI